MTHGLATIYIPTVFSYKTSGFIEEVIRYLQSHNFSVETKEYKNKKITYPDYLIIRYKNLKTGKVWAEKFVA